MSAHNSNYDWSWVLCNANCIYRRLISLASTSTAKILQWILGKGKAFTDQIVAPPFASLRPSTSTTGDT